MNLGPVVRASSATVRCACVYALRRSWSTPASGRPPRLDASSNTTPGDVDKHSSAGAMASISKESRLRRGRFSGAALACWGALLVVAAPMGAVAQGSGDTFVHLFEWKWVDIARECEAFLGPVGIKAVQVSPPSENVKIVDLEKPAFRPWYERYQPGGYKLVTRSGTREEFADMVKRCRAAGVDIYVDAVINHLAAHNDGDKAETTAGSIVHPQEPRFPNIPFYREHFHRDCGIQQPDYHNNAGAVRECRLSGLPDLKLSAPYVRGKIQDYMNDVLSLGVAGFRIDAAKHMHPDDLHEIYMNLDNVGGTTRRPYIFQEVINEDPKEVVSASDYTREGMGSVTEFRYGMKLNEVVKKWSTGLQGEPQRLSYLRSFGEQWDFLPSHKAVVFTDNHDKQRPNHGGGAYLTYRDPRSYKIANAFMLAWDYGYPKIMSGYDWEPYENDSVGPPADNDYNTNSPDIKPDGTCGRGVPPPKEDKTVGTRWVCEHRWRQIYQMVQFRRTVAGTRMQNWWSNGRDQIAFSRGDKGFIAINNDWEPLSRNIRAGLPPGLYCDVISGKYDAADDECTGKELEVNDNGEVFVNIGDRDADPMIATHIGARKKCRPEDPACGGKPPKPPIGNLQRTVIFIRRNTQHGETVFLRGGLDHFRRPRCSAPASSSRCAIHIRHRQSGIKPTQRPVCWQKNDDYLDWYGAEPNQGRCHGQEAEGTPMTWTTDDARYHLTVAKDGAGYTELNRYGESYWMVDVGMDCSATQDGWFEAKAIVASSDSQEIERDIFQQRCTFPTTGISGALPSQSKPPFESKNHVGLCGYVNVFEYESGSCLISSIPRFHDEL